MTRRTVSCWMTVIVLVLTVAGLAGQAAQAAGPRPTVVPTPARAASTTAAAPAMVALAPVRVLDTRIGLGAAKSPVEEGSTTALTVAGRGGVPASGCRRSRGEPDRDPARRLGLPDRVAGRGCPTDSLQPQLRQGADRREPGHREGRLQRDGRPVLAGLQPPDRRRDRLLPRRCCIHRADPRAAAGHPFGGPPRSGVDYPGAGDRPRRCALLRCGRGRADRDRGGIHRLGVCDRLPDRNGTADGIHPELRLRQGPSRAWSSPRSAPGAR